MSLSKMQNFCIVFGLGRLVIDQGAEFLHHCFCFSSSSVSEPDAEFLRRCLWVGKFECI